MIESNKLTAAFRAIPAAAITEVTPDPAADGTTLTVVGTDFTYVTSFTVTSLVSGESFSPAGDVTIVDDGTVTFKMKDVGETGQCSIEAEFTAISKTAILSPAFTFTRGAAATTHEPASTFTDVVVIAPDGDDTLGAGNDTAPFKTWAKAMAATTGNVKVILNSGDYFETFVVPAGRTIFAFGRGACYNNGQGVRSCISMESETVITPAVPATATTAAVEAVTTGQAAAVFMNLKLINAPNGGSIIARKVGAGLRDGVATFVNCEVYNDSKTPSWTFANLTRATGVSLHFRKCTFFRMLRFIQSPVPESNIDCSLVVSDCIIDPGSIDFPFGAAGAGLLNPFTNETPQGFPTFGTDSLTISVSNHTAFPGSPVPGYSTNTTPITTTVPQVPPVYNGATFPKPDLSINFAGAGMTANYFRAGERRGNIGSEGFSIFGMVYGLGPGEFGGGLASANIWRDPQSDGVWISDPDYPNGTDKVPMVRVPVDFTIAANLVQGDCWQLTDTDAEVSGENDSPITKIHVKRGDTAEILYVVAEGDEDAVPATGSKEVIDTVQASSARQIRFRASIDIDDLLDDSLAWTDAVIGSRLTGVTFTDDFYLQTQTIARKDGV